MTRQPLPTVLIIDDSPIDIAFLMENLSSQYAVIVANNGAMGLESAVQRNPDAILMDVSMPEMNGYETCRRLKQQPQTRDIDVIFVSAHDTLEEIITGYDVGGSDYIVKPATPEELHQKVRTAVDNKKQRESRQKRKSFSDKNAQALNSQNELSVVIDFMRTASACTSISDLAKELSTAIEKLQLNNTLQLSSSQGDILCASITPISSLEKELMSRLQNEQAIITHGPRVIINTCSASVLIKNMPDDDEVRTRLIDTLSALIRETEHYLKQIEADIRLRHLLTEAQQAIMQANEEQEQQKQTIQSIFDNLLTDIHKAFDEWGMTESQEASLQDIVNRAMSEFSSCYEAGIHSDDRLKEVVDRLSHNH